MESGSVGIVVFDILSVQSVNNACGYLFFRFVEQGIFLDSFLFSIKFCRIGLYFFEDRSKHFSSFDRLKFISAKDSSTSDGYFFGFASSDR